MTWHVNNIGENNPAYKGDAVGYEAVHIWVRKRKPKPKGCEFCGREVPLDLANKSGKYSRDLDDWNYICRKCHMDSDGRNEQLRRSGQSRKLKDRHCNVCKIVYHPTTRISKFCSRLCFFKARTGHIVSIKTRNKIRAKLMGHPVPQSVRDKIKMTKSHKRKGKVQ